MRGKGSADALALLSAKRVCGRAVDGSDGQRLLRLQRGVYAGEADSTPVPRGMRLPASCASRPPTVGLPSIVHERDKLTPRGGCDWRVVMARDQLPVTSDQ